MSFPTQPSSTSSPTHLRSVLKAPHGHRFNRSGRAKRARGYAASLPQATAPDPTRPTSMRPYSRAAVRIEHDEPPAWMRGTNDAPTPEARARRPTATSQRHESARRAAHPPSEPPSDKETADRRPPSALPGWDTRSHRYRAFKRRTLGETAGQTWVFFAAYEAIPYSAAVILVILLARSLGVLD